MRNDESGPRIAYLLPTGRCNLHCQGCYATLEHWGRHTRKGELSLEDYRRVIAELVDMNVRVFDISGGEPLLYRHLVEVCEAIRSHEGTRIWLVNNGTKLDAAKLERLSGLVERLVVSLDAPYADLHDELRGRKGTFDLALSTLRAARALPFPEVAVNMLVCRPNADSVGDMLALCRREEFDRLSLLSYRDVSENGVMPDMIPDFDALKRGWETAAEALAASAYPRYLDIVAPSFLYPEASEFRRRLPREIQRRLTFHHPHLRGYTAFKETIVVKPFGVLSGDTAMINTDHFDIGSIGEGVRAVWDTQAPAWRERLAERERRLRQEGPCADCSRWHTCRGGCPAAAFHQTGDVGHHDASCTQFRRTGLF